MKVSYALNLQHWCNLLTYFKQQLHLFPHEQYIFQLKGVKSCITFIYILLLKLTIYYLVYGLSYGY